MTLAQLRRSVDRIDTALARLLNDRARLAREIGRLKRARGAALYDPAREAEVVSHVRTITRTLGGPLDEHAIARLFERIIDESRQVEMRDGGDGALQTPNIGLQHAQGRKRPRTGRPKHHRALTRR